jgi:hypothetical protein
MNTSFSKTPTPLPLPKRYGWGDIEKNVLNYDSIDYYDFHDSFTEFFRIIESYAL